MTITTGIKHVFIVCPALDDATCIQAIPEDHDAGYVASWGGATAAFGEIDQYRLYGKRVSATLIERTIDPLDPDAFVNREINTYTQSLELDTDMMEFINPAVGTYDGQEGLASVCGLIDGTYYVYPIVFKDAKICYLPRCSGTGADFTGEICADGVNPFPLEPYYPDCDPPVFPMDAITSWIPSSQPYKDIRYMVTWKYYNLESDPGKTNLQTKTLDVDMRVYPPPFDWNAGKYFYDKYTYFGNGIYH